MTNKPIHMTRLEREIWTVLDTRAGTTVRDIANKVSSYSSNRRSNSGQIAYMLRALEAYGYVKKLDDEKPIAWVAIQPTTEQETP